MALEPNFPYDASFAVHCGPWLVVVWVRVVIFWYFLFSKPEGLGAVRGTICTGVCESNVRILGSESVNNPERRFITPICSCRQRQFNLYNTVPRLELLALYIQMYIWLGRYRIIYSYVTKMITEVVAHNEPMTNKRAHPYALIQRRNMIHSIPNIVQKFNGDPWIYIVIVFLLVNQAGLLVECHCFVRELHGILYRFLEYIPPNS